MRKKNMPDYQGNLDEYRKSLNVIASRETSKAVPVAYSEMRNAEVLWEAAKKGLITIDNPDSLSGYASRMRKFLLRNPNPKNTKVKGLKRNV